MLSDAIGSGSLVLVGAGEGVCFLGVGVDVGVVADIGFWTWISTGSLAKLIPFKEADTTTK
jgi:hypothetical protein